MLTSTMNAMFLMEQMELREALENIESDIEPLLKISEIMQSIDEREKQLFAEIQSVLKTNSEQGQKAAKAVVHKLQFMQKLRQEADDKEAALMDIL